MDAQTEWVVVVPVKELHLAKSRLHHLPAAARSELAGAMAADVVDAASRATAVVGVVVVTNDLHAAATAGQLGARVIADAADAGLDEALRDGARTARTLWPRCGVAALSSDLPCATADTIELALSRAAEHPRSVLADRGGDGTTALFSGPGVELAPSYGHASRSRHVLAGAQQLDDTDLDRLTLDVDTPADLRDALQLGVGGRTSAVMLRLGPLAGRP